MSDSRGKGQRGSGANVSEKVMLSSPQVSKRTIHAHVLCVCSVTQACPTLCDAMDCSPTGSSTHRISQARILKWVAIASFRGSSISSIGRWVLYCWASWEAHRRCRLLLKGLKQCPWGRVPTCVYWAREIPSLPLPFNGSGRQWALSIFLWMLSTHSEALQILKHTS